MSTSGTSAARARSGSPRLSRRQLAWCAIPLLVGPVVGVVGPHIRSRRSPVCQSVLAVAFELLQHERLDPADIGTVVAKLDFDELARDAPARLQGDLELLRRKRARLLVVVGPRHGPLTDGDTALLAAMGRLLAEVQKECA